MNVTCGETMVAFTKSVRYLGVDLDQSSDGNFIAENIRKKGNSRLKFLCRHAQFLNTNSRKLLAFNIISIMHAPHGLVVSRKFTNKNFKFLKLKPTFHGLLASLPLCR